MVCVLLGFATLVLGQPSETRKAPSSWPGYSVQQVQSFHRGFALKDWLKPGQLSHYVWLSMAEFFPNGLVARSGPVSVLEEAPNEALRQHKFLTPEGELKLDDLLQRREVIGLVVLYRGKIAYERYVRMRSSDKYLTQSVSKALVGTVIAILEQRGLVDSERSVDAFLPRLKHTDWSGVRLRDVIDMAAGFDAEGDFLDPATPAYHLDATLGCATRTEKTPGSAMDVIASLKRTHEPGTQYRYHSFCTQVAALVAEEVSGKPFHELLSEEIWARIGAEADALVQMSKEGVPVAYAGISCRLRDLARFGLLYTDSWKVVSQTRVLSEKMLRKIQAGGRIGRLQNKSGSYQWDIIHTDGDLFKGGHGGQGLYVSPSRDLVVAGFGMTTNMSANGIYELSRKVATSGVLDK